MDTPLNPFVNPVTNKPYTSRDAIRISELGYTYAPGSFASGRPSKRRIRRTQSQRTLMVDGIDRALFQGSFVLSAFATIAGPDGEAEERYLGHHAVLSRYSVTACANCRTHMDVTARFPLSAMTDEEVDRATFRVDISHRGEELPSRLVRNLRVV